MSYGRTPALWGKPCQPAAVRIRPPRPPAARPPEMNLAERSSLANRDHYSQQTLRRGTRRPHRACRPAAATIFLLSIFSIGAAALLSSPAAAQVAPPRTSPLARLSVS